MFLKRLQEDQQDMLDLIQERDKARRKGLPEPALPALKVPGPAVQWDMGQAPSPLARRTGPPTVFEGSRPGAQEATGGSAQSSSPGTPAHLNHCSSFSCFSSLLLLLSFHVLFSHFVLVYFHKPVAAAGCSMIWQLGIVCNCMPV